MSRDKITRQALKRAFSSVVSPVIIEVRRGYLNKILPRITPFIENLRNDRPRLFHGPPSIPSPFQPLRRITRFNMLAAVLPREAIFSLADERNIRRIYSNRLMYAFSFPTVPQEGIYQMPRPSGRKEKWVTTTAYTRALMGVENIRFQGQNILIGSLDTGMVRRHEQIVNIIDYDTTTHEQRDKNGHGSWVTTCIGGSQGHDRYLEQQNKKPAPVLGIAPQSLIFVSKCLGYYIGTGSTAGIIESISNSMDQKTKVLNMSLGASADITQPQEDPFHPIFQEVIKKGIIAVVAAGNEGPDDKTVGSPGIFEEVLTVGAYNPISGEIPNFSSRGPTPWGSIKPDCVAPGVNIVSGSTGICDRSDRIPDGYTPLSGTSMATPHVAGLVACMEQAHRELIGKSLTTEEIKRMLAQLGTNKTNMIGWGRIDWGMYKQWLSTEYGVVP